MTQHTENANDIVRNVLIAIGIVAAPIGAFAVMVALAKPLAATTQRNPKSQEPTPVSYVKEAPSNVKTEQAVVAKAVKSVRNNVKTPIGIVANDGSHERLEKMWRQMYLTTISPGARDHYQPLHRYKPYWLSDAPDSWVQPSLFWEIVDVLKKNDFKIAVYGESFVPYADAFKYSQGGDVVRVDVRSIVAGEHYRNTDMYISCTTQSEANGLAAVSQVAALFREFDWIDFEDAAERGGTSNSFNDRIYLSHQRLWPTLKNTGLPVHTELSWHRSVLTTLANQ